MIVIVAEGAAGVGVDVAEQTGGISNCDPVVVEYGMSVLILSLPHVTQKYIVMHYQ